MNILLMMIPMAVLFGVIFTVFFIISVRSGQYEDLDTPAHRLLLDEDSIILPTTHVSIDINSLSKEGPNGQTTDS